MCPNHIPDIDTHHFEFSPWNTINKSEISVVDYVIKIWNKYKRESSVRLLRKPIPQ